MQHSFYTNRPHHPGYRCARTVVLLFILLSVGACSGPGRKGDEKTASGDTPPVSTPYRKPASGFDDTLVIRDKVAIFFSPDSIQLQKIKEILDPRVYENDTHDCFYQMRNARLVIHKYWPALRTVETSRARWLLFLKAGDRKSLVDLDSKGAMCGILLFDPHKDPELVDMMNIETALRYYFEK